jgi:hypothetical protein
MTVPAQTRRGIPVERDRSFRIVTGDSGHGQKSVIFERKSRSRSSGTAGHVQTESAVKLGRNTQLTALHEEVRLFSSRRGCTCRELAAHSRDGILLVEHVSKAFRVSEQAARVRLLKRGILQESNQAGTVDFIS